MSPSPPVHVSAAGASSTDERTSSSSSSSPPMEGIVSKCPKRMAASVEDMDDVLLHVFANYLDMADLLRCAATCWRWRRLIASEAEFICRRDRHVLSAVNVVGFFHQSRHRGDPGRFLPSPSTWRAVPGVVVNNGGDLFKNSRLVASRRGHLLLELCGASGDAAADAALRLAVVNLTTGGVFNLPCLAGKDRPPERYACAFLTAADLHDGGGVNPLPTGSAAGFRVVLLYKRGNDSMACRSWSSGDTNNAWGPEGTVSGANVSRRRLAEMAENAGVAVRGTVFWLSGKVVFGLRVDTLRGTVESPKWYSMHHCGFGFSSGSGSRYPDRRLTVLLDGRLGAVQLGRGDAGTFVVNVFSRNDDGKRRPARRWVWEKARNVDLEPLLPPPPGSARTIRLGAVCEENGLVFFATMDGVGQQQQVASFALDLEKKKVQATLVRHAESCCFCRPSCRLVAFMATTPVAYLTSLGARVR